MLILLILVIILNVAMGSVKYEDSCEIYPSCTQYGPGEWQILEDCSKYIKCYYDNGVLVQENLECPGDDLFTNEYGKCVNYHWATQCKDIQKVLCFETCPRVYLQSEGLGVQYQEESVGCFRLIDRTYNGVSAYYENMNFKYLSPDSLSDQLNMNWLVSESYEVVNGNIRNGKYGWTRCPFTGWNKGWQVQKSLGVWEEDNTMTVTCLRGNENIGTTTLAPTTQTTTSKATTQKTTAKVTTVRTTTEATTTVRTTTEATTTVRTTTEATTTVNPNTVETTTVRPTTEATTSVKVTTVRPTTEATTTVRTTTEATTTVKITTVKPTTEATTTVRTTTEATTTVRTTTEATTTVRPTTEATTTVSPTTEETTTAKVTTLRPTTEAKTTVRPTTEATTTVRPTTEETTTAKVTIVRPTTEAKTTAKVTTLRPTTEATTTSGSINCVRKGPVGIGKCNQAFSCCRWNGGWEVVQCHCNNSLYSLEEKYCTWPEDCFKIDGYSDANFTAGALDHTCDDGKSCYD